MIFVKYNDKREGKAMVINVRVIEMLIFKTIHITMQSIFPLVPTELTKPMLDERLAMQKSSTFS